MVDQNFKALLGVQVDSVERPKTFPKGWYSAVVTGHEFGESTKKKTPYVRMFCKLTSPTEDVDMEDFEAVGGLAALSERKPMHMDFYFTKDALYRITEFMTDTLGMDCAGRNIDECIPETTNQSFLLEVVLTPVQNREGEYYMNPGAYAIVA